MDIESNSLEFEKFLNFLENSNEKILFHIHSHGIIYISFCDAIEFIKKSWKVTINTFTYILNIKIYLILESLNHHPLYSSPFSPSVYAGIVPQKSESRIQLHRSTTWLFDSRLTFRWKSRDWQGRSALTMTVAGTITPSTLSRWRSTAPWSK